MNDQVFPGQPLNDEWLYADPEQLILIPSGQRAELPETPNTKPNPAAGREHGDTML